MRMRWLGSKESSSQELTRHGLRNSEGDHVVTDFRKNMHFELESGSAFVWPN